MTRNENNPPVNLNEIKSIYKTGIMYGEQRTTMFLRHLERLAPEIDAWVEKHFGGRGRALRERSDPPLDGEPWMSMAEAKDLTRLAVIEFLLREWTSNV